VGERGPAGASHPIKSTPTKFIGYVHAPDEKTAIEMAAEDYKICDTPIDRRTRRVVTDRPPKRPF
jgi:hypothetical protein